MEHKKKKRDLLIQISTVRPLLNGMTLDGKKANYAPLFRIPRYAIILWAGVTVPIFKEYANVEDSDCINFYRLDRIADSLLLDFDRTRTASAIYKKLEEKGYTITVTTQDNKTCIKLTSKGEEKCEQDLESLQTLAEYFHSHPGLQARYSEVREQSHLFISKGASSKSYRKDSDLTADKLISGISNWS